MKKIILLASLLLAIGTGNRATAQMQIDCDEAVVARYGFNYEVLDILDQVKYGIICNESKYAFEFVDELPADAIVYQLSDLYDLKDSTQVNATYEDQSLCSYYRYNYRQLQAQQQGDKDIYFQLPAGRKHAYLMLHNFNHVATIVQQLPMPSNNQ